MKVEAQQMYVANGEEEVATLYVESGAAYELHLTQPVTRIQVEPISFMELKAEAEA
jgi:hypothetical protein